MLACMSFALTSAGQARVIPVLVLLAVAAAYFLLTMVINRSVVTVDADHLSVRHGPLPMVKIRGENRIVPLDRVDRVYTVKRGDTCTVEVRSKDDGDPATPPAPVPLLSVEEDEVRAYLIARVIEAALGIPHRPVAEEHRPLDDDELPDFEAWLGMREIGHRGEEGKAADAASSVDDAGPPPRRVRVLRRDGADGPELLVSIPCSTFIYPLFGLGVVSPIWLVATGWDDLFTAKLPWILFNVLALAICAVFLYTVLTGLVNRTVIHVTPRHFRLWHAPLPWPGRFSFPSNEVEQLFLGTLKHTSRSGVFETLSLLVALRSGRQIRLLKGDHPFVRLRWLERIVERELGIADRRVRGEYFDPGREKDSPD